MVGAQMSPDIESYKKCLQENSFDAIAMTFMAGGAVPPDSALKWLSQFKSIQSVIFGASSKSHIMQTRDIILEYLFRE